MDTNFASAVYIENGVLQYIAAVDDDGQSTQLYTAADLQHPARLNLAALDTLRALAPKLKLAA